MALGYLAPASIEQDVNPNRLNNPITDRIDVKSENYNPLQLVYGWKKKEKIDEEVYYGVGPLAKFVLKRNTQGQNRLRVEGRADLGSFIEKNQKLTLFCEGQKLGETVLDREGAFSLDFEISPLLGQDRSLELTIASQNFFGPLNCSLQIFSIYLY